MFVDLVNNLRLILYCEALKDVTVCNTSNRSNSCSGFVFYFNFHNLENGVAARVAELVDAHGSGPCVRKNMLVRFQSRVRGIKLNSEINTTSGMYTCRGCIPIFGIHSQFHSAPLFVDHNSSLRFLS